MLLRHLRCDTNADMTSLGNNFVQIICVQVDEEISARISDLVAFSIYPTGS